MHKHFLDLDDGDKTLIGDKTLEVIDTRHTAATVRKIAEDKDNNMYDIVIDGRYESVEVVPWDE